MLPSSSTLISSPPTSTRQKTIVLFDLAATGHHPVYIKYLVQHWHQTEIAGTLKVVVSPEFIDRHPDVVAFTLQTPQSQIEFVAVSPAEYADFKASRSLVKRSWKEWKLFCRYVEQLGATEAVLMYLDSLQLPLCFGRKSPCPVSGIYFRPSFHYGEQFAIPLTWKERVRSLRQKLLLTRILRNPQLKTLFCLDSFAIAPIQKLSPRAQILPLADPVQLDATDFTTLKQFQQTLAIEPGRRVLLLFGELSQRKGVIKVLEAIQQLSPQVAEQVCLLLAGPIRDEHRATITSAIAALHDQPIQVISLDRYLKGQEIQHCFETADVVLALYQQHVGMSSIVVHAAATQKPLIASHYGLLGALVRQFELGLTVDASNPTDIATAIEQTIQSPLSVNTTQAEQFLQQNLADRFVETLLNTVLN